MTSNRSIPVEVEEAVIDQCVDDANTLCRCALTCRDWLPRSRFHLFSAVCISTPDRLWSFCDVLDSLPELPDLIQSITMAPDRTVKHSSCLLETFPIRLLSRVPDLRQWVLRNNLSIERQDQGCLVSCCDFPTDTPIFSCGRIDAGVCRLRLFSRISSLCLFIPVAEAHAMHGHPDHSREIP
ncbi:hypothetical protein BD309DRAFT_231265 [Dichomitus squalens]|nr:hypothetical protein BD309DRAFT_231265 [Dichomitus squalens]